MRIRSLGSITLMSLGLTLLALAPAAHAQVTVNIFQSGSDVDATATGKLNITGLTSFGSGNEQDLVAGNIAAAQVGINNAPYDIYSGFTGPATFGSGGVFLAASGSGDVFGSFGEGGNPPELVVPIGYTSGTALNGSAVFSGQTLSSLGLTSGTYTYTLPNDTITVQIGPASTPEPGTYALLASSVLTGAGFLVRRRRNACKAV